MLDGSCNVSTTAVTPTSSEPFKFKVELLAGSSDHDLLQLVHMAQSLCYTMITMCTKSSSISQNADKHPNQALILSPI